MKPLARFRALLTPANLFALFLLAGFVGAYLWLRASPERNVFAEGGLEQVVRDLGWWGPLAYMALIALAVVVSQIPGVPLAIAAGAVWGPLTAGLYSVIGGFIGGMIAFYLGRTLGRSAMKALTGKVMTFRRERGERYLGILIFITRLLPVLSFDIISYAAGLSGLSPGIYAVATLLGMIPSTLLLTSLGSAFRFDPIIGLLISGVAAVMLVALPWLIRRYNLFNLRDTVILE